VRYPADRFGRPNGAFRLDGKSGYVTVPDDPDLEADEAFTLSVWVKSLAPGANKGQLLARWGRDEHHADYSLQFERNRRLLFYVCNAAAMETLWGRSTLPHNQWTHVAATFDRGKMAVYMNGKPETSKVSGRVRHTNRQEYEHDDLTIGGYWRGEITDGALDDAALWRRALSPEEIRAVFEMGDLGGALLGRAAPHVSREAGADRIVLKDGRVLKGTIQAEAYDVATSFGRLRIPAERVVGLAAAAGGGRTYLLLADGQVLVGTLGAPAVRLKLASGSTLTVPLREVRQCGYRIGPQRPAALPAPAPVVVLRGGGRLAWSALTSPLQLKAACGTVNLATDPVLGIDRTTRGWVARFANGSVLSGVLQPAKLAMRLRLGRQATIHRAEILRLVLPGKPVQPTGGAVATLRNGDRLLGRLAAAKLTLKTRFGDAELPTISLKDLAFDAGSPGRAKARTWDGTHLEGQLVEKTVAFEIAPGGPTVALPAAQLASLAHSETSLPPALAKQVAELVARLRSESYKDREAASKALIALGPKILPLLPKHRSDPDPEVRQRIEHAIEKLSGKPKPLPQPRRSNTTVYRVLLHD
jgi:hypothetical protein